MKKILLTAFLLIFVLFCELPAKTYIWTDEKGVTHISDRPPKEKTIQPSKPMKHSEQESTKEASENISQSRLQIPGTIVSLIPPSGFNRAERFPGFVSPEFDSSILITQMPGPFSEITKGFNKTDFIARGMNLIEKKDITVCGETGLLLNVTQTALKKLYEKWIVVFGIENETYLVTATFPQDFRDKLSKALQSSILTTQCTSDALKDPFDGLSFNISTATKMKFAKRMGNNITMTKDGRFPVTNETDPILMAGASLSQGLVIEDKKSFCIKRVQSIGTLENIEIERIKSITIDNLIGYEIMAKGTDKYHGRTSYAYQVILFDETAYFIILGIVTETEKTNYLPTFHQIAMSFKQK